MYQKSTKKKSCLQHESGSNIELDDSNHNALMLNYINKKVPMNTHFTASNSNWLLEKN